MSVMSQLYKKPFLVEHNPSWSEPLCLRLPGKDQKNFDRLPPHVTKDILGYGTTLEGAAFVALERYGLKENTDACAYICGPLTELPEALKLPVKRLYSKLGAICADVLGRRAFVPHEHYDPVHHPHFAPPEIDKAERRQIYAFTTHLIAVALEPTWGGGIEVEMTNRYGVPAILLQPAKTISRLLRGNAAFKVVREFPDLESVPDVLSAALVEYAAIA